MLEQLMLHYKQQLYKRREITSNTKTSEISTDYRNYIKKFIISVLRKNMLTEYASYLNLNLFWVSMLMENVKNLNL